MTLGRPVTIGTRSRKRIALGVVAAVGVIVALVVVAFGPAKVVEGLYAFQVFRGSAEDAVRGAIPWPVVAHPLAKWTRGVLLAPHLFIPLGFILLAEWVVPAMKSQRIFSAGLLNDFLWYVAEIGVFLFVNTWVATGLRDLYQRSFGLATVASVVPVPPWLAFVLAVLITDFLAWSNHYVRHKVPLFWCFHTVHHSQRELNALTNERVHPVEFIVSILITFLPATVLGVSVGPMMGFVIFSGWHTRLYHANIRSNYGLLRFVLVTPQSHRVHHSARPEHRDRNFGVIFSVWDHLFGTQCRDYDVYPETGIDDVTFPHERRGSAMWSLRLFLAQQIYPLRLVARRLGMLREP